MNFGYKNYLKLFPQVILVCAFSFAGCSKSGQEPASQTAATEGKQNMKDILAQIHKKLDSPQNGYASETKLAYCDSLYALAKDPATQLDLMTKRAHFLLELGREKESVETYEQLIKQVGNDTASRKKILPMLGLAYMRLAERTNCITGHNADACIMPIQGNGIHQDKAPARKAVEVFETALNEDPNDMDSRWLLNIAYMTLGEYPKGVPKAWLIPGLDAKGATQVKSFTDIASDLNISTNNRAGGVIVDDFDNDGYLDIVTSAWGLDDPMHYFHNNTDGTFTDVSEKSGLKAIMGGLNLMQTDYNNDGFLDIFVLRGAWQGVSGFGEQPNSLLRNNGDGTFTDVTIEAGLLSYRPTQTATWNDFNNDGWLDIFIGNETTERDHLYLCEFYINNGDGTFTNIASENAYFITLFVKGVTSGDFDNDGWPDIFLSCMSGQKMLLRNMGVPGKIPDFEDYSLQSGFDKIVSKTFPTFFFDYDNDGWLDLFTCNYEFDRPLSYYAAKETLHPSDDRAGKMYLFHNNGKSKGANVTFTDVAPKMHVNQTIFAMGSNFGDIDNDGWLDLYLGTGNPSYLSLVPNRMYKNLGGKDFADVTTSAKVGNLQKGHAISFADLNNNGDQDIYAEMGGAYFGDAYFSSFFLNPGQSDNNWICMKLVGTKSNKAAIGAKVKVKFREKGVERSVYRDVNSGGSFGASPLRREIGIGKATVIDEITVTWPASRTVQVFKNVKPNQFIQITEGQESFQPVALKTLTFKKKDGTIPMCAPVAALK